MPGATDNKRTLLPEIGEHVMIRPRGTEREFSLLGTISKRTINKIESTINREQLDTYLPDLAQKHTNIASVLNPVKVEVEVTYSREVGGVHRFNTSVLAKIVGNNATIWMDIPKSVRKSQRRHDFRLPLAARVTLRLDEPKARCQGSMINLSATGAMVVCSEMIKAGQTLELTVETANASEAIDPIQAIIIESTPSIEGQKNVYTLRLSFDDGIRVTLENWQREQIAHYVFEQQRQMLKLRHLMGDGSKARKHRGLTALFGGLTH